MNQDISIIQYTNFKKDVRKMFFKLPQDKLKLQCHIKGFLDGYKFWVDGNLELWCFINEFEF